MQGTVCTTIRVCNGEPEFWRLHQERLQYFSTVLNRQYDLSQIETEVRRHAIKLFHGALRVEIDHQGIFQINTRPLPQRNRLRWHMVSCIRHRSEAEIKWLNREAWVQKREQHHVDVLVLVNDDNQYLECCIGNIFVYRPREQRWFTPEVTSPILPGVMRSVLLSRAETLGDRVIESNIIFESTDELWMSNALRGLCPLTVNDSPPPSWSLLSMDKDLETKALKHFQRTLSRF